MTRYFTPSIQSLIGYNFPRYACISTNLKTGKIEVLFIVIGPASRQLTNVCTRDDTFTYALDELTACWNPPQSHSFRHILHQTKQLLTQVPYPDKFNQLINYFQYEHACAMVIKHSVYMSQINNSMKALYCQLSKNECPK